MEQYRNLSDGNQDCAAQNDILLNATRLVKIYGHTTAINKFDLMIRKGEVIGLLGGNGAGKSTLTRVISGVTVPDEGEMVFDGVKIEFGPFNPAAANSLGIRVVYQELSLCTNLRVYENFFIELSSMFRKDLKWRKSALKLAREKLDEVFPGNDIDVDARLDSLTIAQMQMVEIARAFSDPKLKLLILDEPTSSLPAEQTEQLKDFVRKKAKEGVSFIFITHRLKEAISLVDRIYVAQNGVCKWSGDVSETSEADLIVQMGGVIKDREESRACSTSEPTRCINDVVSVTARSLVLKKGRPINFELKGGEIIGLAGLEGSGQTDLLYKLFASRRKSTHTLEIKGKVAYVTGDRKNEGNFPLWSVLENMMINKLAFGRLWAMTSEKSLIGYAKTWCDKLKVKAEGFGSNINSLSGGNQQKVLIARTMVADADIIILNDPTRGVDIATKHQLYEIFDEAARNGKLLIWYSSDDAEFEICSRVFVMRYNTVVAELSASELSKDMIVEASFKGEELKPVVEVSRRQERMSESEMQAFLRNRRKLKKVTTSSVFVPFLSTLIVYVLCGILSPNVFTGFGIELLLSAAAPLILLSLGQMFIIGFSQIDFGIGYFMGIINVLAATLLSTNPLLGVLVLIALLGLYACMGLVIYYRRIPAIVMTMGASFIWKGAAISILPAPGGAAPEWLTTVFWSEFAVPPTLIIIVIFTILALLFYRSKIGTILKGFGNNPSSMVKSGWSEPWAHFLVYLVSGLFALLGGLIMAGISGAADANAAGPYTMLTVASVVMGGGYLLGGLVTVPGAVFGAITFSLISSLLGFLEVSTELTAAVQGLILLIILSLRLFKKGGKQA